MINPKTAPQTAPEQVYAPPADPFDEATPDAWKETYTVEVDGQPIPLTMEQLLDAAAAGLSRRNDAVRTQRAAANMPRGDVYAEFLAEYPDIAPADIPPEVWQQAEREGSLVAAYRMFELGKLRAELDALKQNQENAKAEIGTAVSDGETPESDPVIRALLG